MTDNAIAVTLVTKDASVDFTDAQYREVLLSLWEGKAQREYPKLLAMLEEPTNRKAWWHHRVNGNRTTFGPDERNKVRQAWWQHRDASKAHLATTGANALAMADAPRVNPPVTDVTQQMVHPDAEVLLVGTLDPGERVRRVLFIAANDVAVFVNGEITAKPLQAALSDFGNGHTQTGTPANVTHVTGAVAAQAANRESVYRPVFSTDEKATFEALGGLRRIIDAGVKALQEDGR
jgi:hypothetical protein